MPDDRSLEFEIEVPGSPEEVWEMIATGPGISSWYVPHTVEEREGGSATARFGPGTEMEVPGRVAAWNPPKRVVFDGGEDVEGFAFEWLVEGHEGGTCIVRLVNSGFGSGDDWDAQYDAMGEGWLMFLENLRLRLAHFPSETATAVVPTANWSGARDDAWSHLASELGIANAPAVGDRIEVRAEDAPALAGVVADATPWRLSLVVEEPVPGTAIIAAESVGDAICVSVWTYLNGSDGAAIAVSDEATWQRWLESHAPEGETTGAS